MTTSQGNGYGTQSITRTNKHISIVNYTTNHYFDYFNGCLLFNMGLTFLNNIYNLCETFLNKVEKYFLKVKFHRYQCPGIDMSLHIVQVAYLE